MAGVIDAESLAEVPAQRAKVSNAAIGRGYQEGMCLVARREASPGNLAGGIKAIALDGSSEVDHGGVWGRYQEGIPRTDAPEVSLQQGSALGHACDLAAGVDGIPCAPAICQGAEIGDRVG